MKQSGGRSIKPRIVRRLLARTRTDPSPPIRTDRYFDFDDLDLVVHVAKHVLRAKEGWADLLGRPVPELGETGKDACYLVDAGKGVRHAIGEMRSLYGRRWHAAFRALFWQQEMQLLQEAWRVPAFRSALGDYGRARKGSPLEAKDTEKTLFGVVQRLVPGERVADVTSFLRLEVWPDSVEALLEALTFLARDATIWPDEPIEGLLQGSPPSPKTLDAINGLRLEFPVRASGALFEWAKKREEAEATLRKEYAAIPAIEDIEEAYLKAGHDAATEAGLAPRHCDYQRHFAVGTRGYVGGRGIAVVTGPDGTGQRRVYTIHRPAPGKTAREKAIVQANREAARAEYSLVSSKAAKAFLKQLKDCPRALYCEETWLA